MTDATGFLGAAYPWVKAAHITFVIFWIAGLLLLHVVIDRIDFAGFPAVATSTVLRLAAVAGLASALRLFGRGNYPLFLAGAAAGALVAWAR